MLSRNKKLPLLTRVQNLRHVLHLSAIQFKGALYLLLAKAYFCLFVT
jgi:hypothetical protein